MGVMTGDNFENDIQTTEVGEKFSVFFILFVLSPFPEEIQGIS
jgi:hypothetical protein